MKTALRNISLLALFAFAGLAQAASDSKAVIDSYMAAWNAKDAEKAATYFSEDGEYFDVTVGTSQKGRVAARDNVIKVFIDAAPDLKWVMTSEPIVTKDGIAFQWRFSGTNTGAWGPETPATGKPFSFEGVSFVRLNDGKITYQGDYYDAKGFYTQLGW